VKEHALLTSYCFDGTRGGWQGGGPDVRGFYYSLPWPEGTTLVQLKEGQNGLAQRAASAHAPTVHVIAPNGGETWAGDLTLRWSGSDADGDTLHYSVRFSRDGGTTWVPLAVDTLSTTLVVDSGYLGGGGPCDSAGRV